MKVKRSVLLWSDKEVQLFMSLLTFVLVFVDAFPNRKNSIFTPCLPIVDEILGKIVHNGTELEDNLLVNVRARARPSSFDLRDVKTSMIRISASVLESADPRALVEAPEEIDDEARS